MGSNVLSGIDISKLGADELAALVKQVDAVRADVEAKAEAQKREAFTQAVLPMAEYIVSNTEYIDYGKDGKVWAGYQLPATTIQIGGETYTVSVSMTDKNRTVANKAAKAKADAAKLGLSVETPVSLVKPPKDAA